MHVATILERRRPAFSLEFFPPKTEDGWGRLFRVIAKFAELEPDFVSVTYGAGGTTREQTHELVRRIAAETTITVVPHLTCVCHTRTEVAEILRRYAGVGIGGIMALGGDPPRALEGECRSEYVYAFELVRQIREFRDTEAAARGAEFAIGVAGFPEGHPATPHRVHEIDHLKRKVDEGADYICTQLFFDNRDFYDFRERCETAGITVPIVAGIMPVTSLANFERLPSLALGSRYPARLIRTITSYEDDEDVEKAGVEWATEQCADLLRNGVRGVHFYTLNRLRPIRNVWRAIASGAG
ncbi:MAG: methylenetetrahydrofolate reductase [NAD(P)H] [Spirochaetota bacterium]